jgi:hypothetical protein
VRPRFRRWKRRELLLASVLGLGLALFLAERGWGAWQLRQLGALTADQVLQLEVRALRSTRRDASSDERAPARRSHLLTQDPAEIATYLEGLSRSAPGSPPRRARPVRTLTVTLRCRDGREFEQTLEIRPLPDRGAMVGGPWHSWSLRSPALYDWALERGLVGE